MKDCLVFFWALHLIWVNITRDHKSKASLALLLVAQHFLPVSQAVSHHLQCLLSNPNRGFGKGIWKKVY